MGTGLDASTCVAVVAVVMEKERKQEIFVTLCKLVPRLSLRLPARELSVLSRLIYRGKNQHRRDTSFQKLTKVAKDVKRCISVNLCFNVKSPLGNVQRETKDGMSEACVQLVQTAPGLVDSAMFVVKLLDFMEETFRELLQRLQSNLFVPFNLVMCATLSRLWFYMRLHLTAVCETYRQVQLLGRLFHVEVVPLLNGALRSKLARYLPVSGGALSDRKLSVEDSTADKEIAISGELLSQRMRDFAMPGLATADRHRGSVTTSVYNVNTAVEESGVQVNAIEQQQQHQNQQQQQQHIPQSPLRVKRVKRANSVLIHCKGIRGRMRVCVRSKRLVALLEGRAGRRQMMAEVLVHPGRQTPWGNGNCAVRFHWQSPLSAVKKRAKRPKSWGEWMNSQVVQKSFQQDTTEAAKYISAGRTVDDIDTIFSLLQD